MAEAMPPMQKEVRDWLGDRNPLDVIDGQRFTASDIFAAVRITRPTLNNYLTKTDLRLCSESAGERRTRHYCVIDVYQIALFHALVTLNSSMQWTAKVLNWQLFGWWEMASLAADPEVRRIFGCKAPAQWVAPDEATFRDQCCISLRAAPEFYRHRDYFDPLFLVSSPAQWSLQRGDEQDGDEGGIYRSAELATAIGNGAVVLNVTHLLRALDESLVTVLWERRK